MHTLDIVVYLDGSSAARRAVVYLAPLAHFAHVQITLLLDQQHEAQAELLFSNAERLLQAANTPVRSIRGSTPERAIVLAARACDADLVVFGPLSRQGWQRWLGQPSVRSLARRLTTSMLLMRGRPNELRRALLCAAGGSEVLRDAEVTADLLGPLQAQVTILHILSQMPLIFEQRINEPEFLWEQMLAADSRVLSNIEAARTILHAVDVETKVRIRVGMVVEEIKAELRTGGYDLLVLGAHRTTTPLDRVLLEDISAELLRDSPVPVLLVHNIRGKDDADSTAR